MCLRYVGRYLFTIVSYLIGVFVFATIVGMSYVVTDGALNCRRSLCRQPTPLRCSVDPEFFTKMWAS